MLRPARQAAKGSADTGASFMRKFSSSSISVGTSGSEGQSSGTVLQRTCRAQSDLRHQPNVGVRAAQAVGMTTRRAALLRRPEAFMPRATIVGHRRALRACPPKRRRLNFRQTSASMTSPWGGYSPTFHILPACRGPALQLRHFSAQQSGRPAVRSASPRAESRRHSNSITWTVEIQPGQIIPAFLQSERRGPRGTTPVSCWRQ